MSFFAECNVEVFIQRDVFYRSKGYGFVEFQTSSSIEQVQENRPHKINNQEVQTVRTYPKSVSEIHLCVYFLFCIIQLKVSQKGTSSPEETHNRSLCFKIR